MNYQEIYRNKPDSYFEGESQQIIKYVPENINIVLDVGCSSGGFGQLLKQKGLTVWGVEPNAKAASVAESKLDMVINSLFDDSILPVVGNTKFDCIFFNDVIEHFIDPLSALELCKKILSPGGCIISAIPNVLQYGNILTILKKQDWEYVDAGILDRTHFRFYSKKSIIRLFEEAGYSILNITGWYKTCSIKFKILNLILLNKIETMKYSHFITIVKIK